MTTREVFDRHPRRRRATEDAGGAMVLTKIGYGLSGLLGAGIIVIGARFLVAPRTAATRYGITTEQGGPASVPCCQGRARYGLRRCLVCSARGR